MRRVAYIFMISLALLGASLPAEVEGAPARGFAGHTMHGGGFRGGGFGGHRFDGGTHFRNHFVGAGHFRHHQHFRGSVFVGVDPLWLDPWWPYPYPYPRETVVVRQPQEYIYSAPEAWYYCRASGQYFPYVRYCPGGWSAVSPPLVP